MAMQTGTFNGANNAIETIKNFIVANGWTLNDYSTIGAGRRLHANKNGCFINGRSLVGESWQSPTATQSNALFIYPSTGYNAANPYYNQPGRHPHSSEFTAHGMVDLDGSSMTYYLYELSGSGYDTVLCFVNTGGEVWQHLGFGNLKKADTFTGGAFSFGSMYPNQNNPQSSYGLMCRRPNNVNNVNSGLSMVYVTDIGGYTGWAYVTGFGTPGTPVVLDEFFVRQNEMNAAPTTWNNAAPLDPFAVYCSLQGSTFTEGSTPWGKLGTIPNLFLVNNKDYASGSLYTLGSDNYRVFPLYAKDTGGAVGNVAHSGLWAVAVKE